MTPTTFVDMNTFRNPSRPFLHRVRPNTPIPTGTLDVTNRKFPPNVGLWMGNPLLAPPIVSR
jgi:hypothetical protein